MSAITTHVLDVSIGRPAAGVSVTLERRSYDEIWEIIGNRETDTDGRVLDLISGEGVLSVAVYRLTFETGEYFKARQVESFYQDVTVAFRIDDPAQHYHVPLLLSPFGYSTYRGS